MSLARIVLASMCLPLLGATWQDGCAVCKVGAIPVYNTAGWTEFGAGSPVGVTVAFLNPQTVNGQCPPPESCATTKCKWWGTFQITNGSPANLTNAQISANGVLISSSGQLNIGAKRKADYTSDKPLEASCGTDADIEFSITSGANVFSSTLKLTCGACPVTGS